MKNKKILIKKLLNDVDKILCDKMSWKFKVDKDLMQRGIADEIEKKTSKIIGINIKSFGKNLLYEEAYSKRSIEDFKVVDLNYSITCMFDVKTTDLCEGNFSMPNLVSIDRLRKFYSIDNNYIIYTFIEYEVDNIENEKYVIIKSIKSNLIENISWNCLRIQNLGKGQLQIIDKKLFEIDNNITRKLWLNNLKKSAINFYNELIKKTEKRKKMWESY